MLMSVSDIGTTATGTGHGWLLPALLVLCLAVIAMQTVAIVRKRRLTARKNNYIACYVGQYLSLKYKEFPELCKWHSGSELTQIELIKVMHLLKKMLCGCVLLLPTLPAVAQERTDTTYVFRFVPTDDMFYVPFGDNEAELERLENCVERYYDEIREGVMPLRVDGYSRSESGHEANLLTAKLRSNRIKSELITRQGLTEDCFITKNHVGKGDYVTVRLTIPKDGTQPVVPKEEERTAVPDETKKSDNALVAKEEETPAEEPQTWPVQAEQPQSDETVQAIPVEKESKADAYRFSLRANLLRWATLTPDLGIEWRISPSVGIMVNGSWTSWTWNDNAVQGRTVQLQVLRHGQAGRPSGRRHHRRLPAAADRSPRDGLHPRTGLPERRYGAIRCDRWSAGAQRQRDETLDRPDQRRSNIGLEDILTRRNRI